jgi:hypothetical protein
VALPIKTQARGRVAVDLYPRRYYKTPISFLSTFPRYPSHHTFAQA